MCVECKTALNVSTSAVAEQERDFIRRQIALGKTKQEVKDALVEQFGHGVLADAGGEGLRPRRLPRAARPGAARAGRAGGRGAPLPPPPGGRPPRPPSRSPTTTRAAWTRSSRPTTAGERRRRHHGRRGLRGRLRLLHLALRAAARARLPVGRLGRDDGRARSAASAARVLLPAVVFCLSFTVVFVALGMTATEPRLDAPGLARHARQDRRRGDHRARPAVRGHAVRAAPEPRMAARRADLARRLGRPADRRGGVRVRVDAVRRADAGRDPHRRLGAGHGRQGRAAAGLLLGRARGAVHAHRARLQPRDDRLPLAARPLDDRDRRLGGRADRDGPAAAHAAS